MFAGLFVVFFVETADQFFENAPHAVIAEAGRFAERLRAEMDFRGNEFFHQKAKGVGFVQFVELSAEIEFADDLLNVVGKPVEVSQKVRFELFGVVEQSPQSKGRSIIKRLFGGLAKGPP